MNLEEMKINLRTLWDYNYNDLETWVDSLNVIYKIENLINGKVYIGQAKWFYGRLVENAWSHRVEFYDYCKLRGTNRRIYNSIRKYHSRNFEVSIIEICESSEDLNSREIYWVSYYDSFRNGYNMTSGGDNCENLHSDEVWKYRELQGNGDSAYMIHSKESYETNRKNHGGVLAWNTPEAIRKYQETNARKYNGDIAGQCHTKEAYDHRSITRLINKFNWYLDQLELAGCSRPISFHDYWNESIDYWYPGDLLKHIRCLFKRLNQLRSDSRWTPEMNNIISELESNKDKYNI